MIYGLLILIVLGLIGLAIRFEESQRDVKALLTRIAADQARVTDTFTAIQQQREQRLSEFKLGGGHDLLKRRLRIRTGRPEKVS